MSRSSPLYVGTFTPNRRVTVGRCFPSFFPKLIRSKPKSDIQDRKVESWFADLVWWRREFVRNSSKVSVFRHLITPVDYSWNFWVFGFLGQQKVKKWEKRFFVSKMYYLHGKTPKKMVACKIWRYDQKKSLYLPPLVLSKFGANSQVFELTIKHVAALY